MMPEAIINVENVSKHYRINAPRSRHMCLRDKISSFFSLSHRKGDNKNTTLSALDNISFSIEEGDKVGIIGRNGAGKSTLLKVLSRITAPSSGSVTMRGRVASLLEVGTGFHMELTGRENIFLNGVILGMSRGEIVKRFDEIVAFSEIEAFLDMPVKHYSSGMYLKLAFSIAAHIDPEILIVDEVLSVGDVQFQQKCLGKMDEVSRRGRTVIFVSHNLPAVQKLCTKSMVLDKGRLVYFGPVSDGISAYLRSFPCSRQASVDLSGREDGMRCGGLAKILKVEILNEKGELCRNFFTGDKVTVKVDVMFFQQISDVQMSFAIRAPFIGNIYHCLTRDADLFPKNVNGKVSFMATFPKLALYPDLYYLDDIWVSRVSKNETLDHVNDIMSFQIEAGGKYLTRDVSRGTAIVHEVPLWDVIRENG